MTNTFDLELPKEAKAFLDAEGITWRVWVPTFTPDPETGTSERVDVPHDVKGSPRFQYDIRLVSANLVQRDSTYILFAGLGLPFTPEGPDQGLRLRRVISGSEQGPTFVVRRVTVHETGDLVALYELELGR